MLPENNPTTYRKHPTIRATHPFYACWYNIYQRCKDPNHPSFSRYGGRGITVCVRWEIFQNFYEDMFSGWRKGLEIERIDNDAGYSTKNCTWATRKQQLRNTSVTKLTAADVEQIRLLRQQGWYHKTIAAKFGVSQSHITRILNRQKWND